MKRLRNSAAMPKMDFNCASLAAFPLVGFASAFHAAIVRSNPSPALASTDIDTSPTGARSSAQDRLRRVTAAIELDLMFRNPDEQRCAAELRR